MSVTPPVSSSRRRSSMGTNTNQNDSNDAIKVICRFRPPKANRRESMRIEPLNGDKVESYNLDEERGDVEFCSDLTENKSFKFDKVFGVGTEQFQVFDEVKGVVDSVMAGFNGTVMAYGQTSAGKSFTMEGLSLWDSQSQGVIPRCVDALFDAIVKADPDNQFQVVLSYYEIYCEKVRDLLNPASVNMKIRETKGSGFMVQDLTEIYCTDRDSVLRIIELGKTNRAAAPTLMNADSSRSHSIVSILVDQKNLTTGRNKRGNLYLVDLAGSEKVSKTGASGLRLEEAKNINSSLTTLGMVINSLCDGAGHVPYRDSKLTMILMDALGGNSKTTLIICCNPDNKHIPETLSTLRFGERAKRIKNHARVNEEYSLDELKTMLSLARKEIKILKTKLQNSENPVDSLEDLTSLDPTSPLARTYSTQSMVAVEEELKNEINRLNGKIIGLEEELDGERLRFKEEHEQRMLNATEAEALKSSIADLEEKLLKSNLNAKRPLPPPPPILTEDGLPEIDYAEEMMKLRNKSPEVYTSPNKSFANSANKNKNSPGTPAQDIETSFDSKAVSKHSPNRLDVSVLDQTILNFDNDDDEGSDNISITELDEQTKVLNSQLAEDIRNLSKSMSVQQMGIYFILYILFIKSLKFFILLETKNAQDSAQTYVDKYVKLREEYEMHVQRLMLKLTQEQQMRSVVEDKLEDAYSKLWHYTNRYKSSARGFFASIFGSRESNSNRGRSSSISFASPSSNERYQILKKKIN